MNNSGGSGQSTLNNQINIGVNAPFLGGITAGPARHPMQPMSGAHTHTISIPKKQYFKADIIYSGRVVTVAPYNDIVAEYFEFKDGILYGYSNVQQGMYVGGGGRSYNTLSSVTPLDKGMCIRIVQLDEDSNYIENLKNVEGEGVQAIRNFVEMLGGGNER